ncbi:toll/interleukin-1 receptor domain-containing protein [Azohydromonas caseinilytica]|uniref:Toll/interleukin-1 receptor domain-containing protein n=1 Tax=Azohydromonas caseinilytica TaxID=2728836 RepID=A0A848FAW4_9BURK|nr:toll/interleukin-1 receptor domain-containing protein [Azohydromonas caseinilytica]NML15895.1 toll/interleukin-1 receptor domain-containing protein [Azohydromonas caseinilytica]
MNEAAWRRLLSQIRDGMVVPVVGPQLLVGRDGEPSLQARVARRLLQMHEGEPGAEDPDAPLPPLRELHEAVSRLKPHASLQDLYGDVHAALQELTAGDDEAVVPPPLRQLAQISDFRLLVTLTPDDLLARSLRRRCAVNEIVHSPRLPTSEGRDLLPDWLNRPGEVHLLYLFGKSRPAPMFALHDEDVLEYAHNLIARGGHVPGAFLGELQERSLLLLGCSFPDWLGRFFLRVTNKSRLSEKAKREWLIEEPQPEAALTGFLRSYSRDTEVLSQVPPAQFVAELHRRWSAEQAARPAAAAAGTPAGAAPPPRPLFFISYSRATDLPRAQALFEALLKVGVAEGEIWFDRRNIEPGHDFAQRIEDGIRGCRYFLPLLSEAALAREEAFVFREWRAADDRRQGMNRPFLFPVIVDEDYEPERYGVDPVRAWAPLDFGHAPDGVPDGRLMSRLKALVREARRPEVAHGSA